MSKKYHRLLPTLLWASIIVLALFNVAYSANLTPNLAHNIDPDKLTELASSKTWLRLTKIEHKGKDRYSTDILSDNFYLATGSPPSPLDELQATVTKALSPLVEDQPHAQCRFPARVHWLKTQLPGFAEALPQIECDQLQKWSAKTADQRFYLVHVSGYFANPASAFGHLLLRIGDGETRRGLLDTGINFGAKIPPDDGSLTYMMKGLFGGYTASFSSKEHYLQDKVYSDTESRDMWAYELQLDAEQSLLLRYHLWEIIDQPFEYYFLKKNCAYRVAELLNLVFDSDFFIDEHSLYYAPVQLFNKLERYDSKHGGQLISKVNFVPSHKRESFEAFESLDSTDATQANHALEQGSVDSQREQISPESLDFLLEYLDYKIQLASTDAEEPLRQLKQQTLNQRFRHPAKSIDNRLATILAPPGGGPPPATARLSFSNGTDSRPDDSSLTLELSPFSYDTLDQNRGSMIDSGFEALTLELKLQDESVRFERLTILDIQKYTASDASIYGEPTPLAWRGAAVIENRADCATTCPVGRFSGSLGRSSTLGSGVVFSTFDALLTTNLRDRQLGISAGSLYNFPWDIRGNWRSAFNLYSNADLGRRWTHEIRLQKSLGQRHALDVSWEYNTNALFTFGYKVKW